MATTPGKRSKRSSMSAGTAEPGGVPGEPAEVSGSTFRVTAPATIPDKTRAWWEVRAWDGYAYSPWSYAGSATACYFTIDRTLPDAPAVTSAAYPASDPDNPDDPWIDGVGRRLGTRRTAFAG